MNQTPLGTILLPFIGVSGGTNMENSWPIRSMNVEALYLGGLLGYGEYRNRRRFHEPKSGTSKSSKKQKAQKAARRKQRK